MKNKLTNILVSALAAVACCACGSDGGGAANGGVIDSLAESNGPATDIVDTLTSEQMDTMSSLYGTIYGNENIDVYDQLSVSDPMAEYDKDAYIDGVALAVCADPDNEAYLMGVKEGIRAMQEICRLGKHGVAANRELMMAVVEHYLMLDSITAEEANDIEAGYNKLLYRINNVSAQP